MGLKAGTLSTLQLSSILCTLKTYSVFKVPHSFGMWSVGIAIQERLFVHLIILRLGTRVAAGSKTDLQPASSSRLCRPCPRQVLPVPGRIANMGKNSLRLLSQDSLFV